jgi:hypothetical protein
VETAAGRPAGVALLNAAVVCRARVKPVTVLGDPEWGMTLHAGRRRELGPDGHLVAPIDAGIIRASITCKAGARS